MGRIAPPKPSTAREIIGPDIETHMEMLLQRAADERLHSYREGMPMSPDHMDRELGAQRAAGRRVEVDLLAKPLALERLAVLGRLQEEGAEYGDGKGRYVEPGTVDKLHDRGPRNANIIATRILERGDIDVLRIHAHRDNAHELVFELNGEQGYVRYRQGDVLVTKTLAATAAAEEGLLPCWQNRRFARNRIARSPTRRPPMPGLW